MNTQISLRPAWWPATLCALLGAVGATWSFHEGHPAAAALILAAALFECLRYARAMATLPRCLALQGLRWWCVDGTGELIGPYRLRLDSHVGPFCVVLHLEGLQGGGRRLWLRRAFTDAEGWAELQWRVREHAASLRAGGNASR